MTRLATALLTCALLSTVLLATVLLATVLLATALPAQSQDLTRPFPWRNIGPANMMGRISAVDGYDADWRVFLVGAASGGVWKTTNGGTTFTPIFDEHPQSIGDVAFFQADTSTVWVGTGEATNRNSVGWGDGVYKSTDGGRTFAHAGLRDTYQISEIAPHPSDPDVVYVAAIGHLFDYGGQRGLFKTVDGGKTWVQLTNGLPVSDRLGATVVAIDPLRPETVYVGLYDRLRRPHDMQSGGPDGGLFKSTDGGASWTRLTNGLPTGITGQIDVDIYTKNPDIVVAFVETSEDVPANQPGSGVYRSDDGGASWRFIQRNFSRPTYHGRVRIDPTDDRNVFVISRAFAYSRDGGETFEDGRPWQVDGGDDHDLWISPQDGRVIVMATDQGARISLDGGESAFMLNNMAIGQYYAIGADMRDPYWVYGGLQDNGGWAIPSHSRDRRGILTDHAFEVNGGDGFHMQPDPTDWRTVYTATHVGFFGRADVETREHAFITPTPETITNFAEIYDPEFDGRPIDYTINPGNYWLWGDAENDMNGAVLPPQFRFNWNSPLVLSPTEPHTVYVGGSHLFESTDRGESWRIISLDLTLNDPATRNPSESGGLTKDVTGAENHHTIYTIDPSPLDPNVIWVGTDDGLVQVTRDRGASWQRAALPMAGYWVSRVEASKHDAGTAYVTLDGHWVGDTAPYVFRTRDFGRTWTDLSAGLPHETPGGSVYTLVEDPVDGDLLFVGTEFGCYFSVDGGSSWGPFMNGLPPVAVHDLIIHPRDHDLIAGTHGRSIWIADDISGLRSLGVAGAAANGVADAAANTATDAASTAATRTSASAVVESRPGTRWLDFSKGRDQTHFKFRGENPPRGAAVTYFLTETPADSTVRVVIRDPASGRERSFRSAALAGLNRAYWNLQFDVDSASVARQRSLLLAAADTVAAALAAWPNDRILFHLARDLRAPHRAPNRFEGADYPRDDDRGLLEDHLGHIRARLAEANSAREINGARSALLTFVTLVGDRAYFGFFGRPLASVEAEAGTYPVVVLAGDIEIVGTVSVREDPLKR